MNIDSAPDPELTASTDRPRLVRSRTGRLIAAPEPKKVERPVPMTRRAKVLATCGGLTAFGLLVALFVATQGKATAPVQRPSGVSDAGYVIKEVHGPGLIP